MVSMVECSFLKDQDISPLSNTQTGANNMVFFQFKDSSITLANSSHHQVILKISMRKLLLLTNLQIQEKDQPWVLQVLKRKIKKMSFSHLFKEPISQGQIQNLKFHLILLDQVMKAPLLVQTSGFPHHPGIPPRSKTDRTLQSFQ